MSSDDAPKPLTLGRYLEMARNAAGLSRVQLANLTGVGRMTISRLETGYYQNTPDVDDIGRLARALELNVTDLYLLAGIPVPKKAASLEVMLRTGYGVDAADVPALKQQIEALIAEHNQPLTETNPTLDNQQPTKGGDHD